MEVHVDRAWVGRTIEQMEEATDADPVPVPDGLRIVPKRSTVFQDGDLAYAAVVDAKLAVVEAILGAPPRGV